MPQRKELKILGRLLPPDSPLKIVTEWAPTADGKGRLFKISPGMAVVLDQYDQWEINKEEDWLGQSPRIF